MNSDRLNAVAKPLYEIGGVLVAVGTGLFEICDHRPDVVLSHPRLILAWKTSFFLGIPLAAAGLLLVLIRLALKGAEQVQTGISNIAFTDIDSPHVHRYAQPSELSLLHEQYKFHFDNNAPSLELMTTWHSRCPTCFVSVYRGGGSTNVPGTLVGSFKVLPLSKSGVRAIESGQATGSTLRDVDICSTTGRAAAYYVGDVCATGLGARAHVLSLLDSMCADFGDAAIYARPLSKEGHRVMMKRGFVRARDNSATFALGELCKRPPMHRGQGSAD